MPRPLLDRFSRTHFVLALKVANTERQPLRKMKFSLAMVDELVELSQPEYSHHFPKTV